MVVSYYVIFIFVFLYCNRLLLILLLLLLLLLLALISHLILAFYVLNVINQTERN